jgi:hypothetical protein
VSVASSRATGASSITQRRAFSSRDGSVPVHRVVWMTRARSTRYGIAGDDLGGCACIPESSRFLLAAYRKTRGSQWPVGAVSASGRQAPPGVAGCSIQHAPRFLPTPPSSRSCRLLAGARSAGSFVFPLGKGIVI